MGLSTVAEFKIQRLEILDAEGKIDSSVKLDISDEKILEIYRKMVEIRMFDEKAFKLQRQGRLGTYPQILGQEASQIVPALCLDKKDWCVPTYRGQGVYYARGMQLRYSLLYWGGDDRGVTFPKENNDMIFAVPVGSHLTQVTGLAWSIKMKKEKGVALTYVGDGTSSKGDLHESLTFAGQMKLPLIVIIENNHWAISVPREKQAASKTLAQKCFGYGVAGLQVDGNDALAIHKAMTEAVERGRTGGGATLLELETYRMGHHTTADDATRYRPAGELEVWAKKDPILRLKRYIESKGIWDEAKEKKLVADTDTMIAGEVEAYEKTPAPNPLDMFANNYSVAPWHLIEQRKELEELLEIKKGRNEVEELPPVEGRFP